MNGPSLEAELADDDDDPAVKIQRERYQELVQELRVLLPGVQVLFAFLLTTPFTQRFTEISSAQRGGYLAALVLTASATVVFMAPVIGHRVATRQHRTSRLRQAIALQLVGSVLLVLAMITATVVVVTFVYDGAAAVAVSVLMGSLVVGAWLALPLAGGRT